MNSIVTKQKFLVGVDVLEQNLCGAGSVELDLDSLQKDSSSLLTLLEELKCEGRLSTDELVTAEEKLKKTTQILQERANKLYQPEGYLSSATKTISSFFSSLGDGPSQQMQRKENASKMKGELLYSARNDSSSVRFRSVDKKETSMQQHQQVHEDIASDMINLTKTLKHNISSSAKIIKDDINTLKSATSNTESNLQQLKKESTRLDTHMNKSSCWLWMALIAVALTFVAVIFLIRFFPKPR